MTRHPAYDEATVNGKDDRAPEHLVKHAQETDKNIVADLAYSSTRRDTRYCWAI